MKLCKYNIFSSSEPESQGVLLWYHSVCHQPLALNSISFETTGSELMNLGRDVLLPNALPSFLKESHSIQKYGCYSCVNEKLQKTSCLKLQVPDLWTYVCSKFCLLDLYQNCWDYVDLFQLTYFFLTFLVWNLKLIYSVACIITLTYFLIFLAATLKLNYSHNFGCLFKLFSLKILPSSENNFGCLNLLF